MCVVALKEEELEGVGVLLVVRVERREECVVSGLREKGCGKKDKRKGVRRCRKKVRWSWYEYGSGCRRV